MAKEDEITLETVERMVSNCRHGSPTEEEQDTIWYQACLQFIPTTTPMDSLHEHSSFQEIGRALIQTNQIIVQHPVFNRIRTTPKASHCLAALAVDAWANKDMKHVQFFLLKAVVIEQLQLQGPEAIMREMMLAMPDDEVSPTGSSLLYRIQQILQLRDLPNTLIQMTRGSCQCVTLIQALMEGREHPQAAAERKEREVQQLPPVLRPHSKLWNLKKKAAACLKAGKLGDSINLYTKGLKLIEDQLCLDPSETSTEWVGQLSRELSKIQSNLALVHFNRQDYDEALRHADEAVANFPTWSKPHSRRAQALEALGQLDHADAAIAKALDFVAVELENEEGSFVKRQEEAEYLKVQKRLEVLLDAQQVNTRYEAVPPELRIDQETCDLGWFLGGLFTLPGVMETVVICLTPVDVEQLEQTCRGFAEHAEPMRRLSLCSPLWNLGLGDLGNEIIRTYCYDTTRNIPSSRALSNVISHVVKHAPLSSHGSLPDWLDSMLRFAQPPARIAIESVCSMAPSPLPLRKGLCCWVEEHVLDRLVDADFDDADIVRGIHRNDHDGEVMRLHSWLRGMGVTEFSREGDLLTTSNMFLHNFFVVHGERVLGSERLLGSASQCVAQVTEFCSVFATSLPLKWPCEEPFDNWEHSAEDVDSFWLSNPPRVFRRWKVAFADVLKWVRESEQCGDRLILVTMCLIIAKLPHSCGEVPVNAFSFAVFLMKRCFSLGGCDALEKSLRTQLDHAELVADYYSMVRLYSETIPAMLEWHQTALAQHHAMFG